MRLQNLGYPGEKNFLIEYGDAAGVLAAHSPDAEISVVGARGRGGFIGRLLGSVSSALPAHAHCPAVIVGEHYSLPDTEGEARYTRTDDRPVVVGMDQAPGSQVAALHAAEFATGQGAPLRLVVALPDIRDFLIVGELWSPGSDSEKDRPGYHRRRELENWLENQVQWLSKHFPQLDITYAVVDGSAIEVLQKESSQAQLTVLGTRGRGGITSALLGSTSTGVMMHGAGPVMVVPDAEDPRLDD